jgi:hypothetical protein
MRGGGLASAQAEREVARSRSKARSKLKMILTTLISFSRHELGAGGW